MSSLEALADRVPFGVAGPPDVSAGVTARAVSDQQFGTATT